MSTNSFFAVEDISVNLTGVKRTAAKQVQRPHFGSAIIRGGIWLAFMSSAGNIQSIALQDEVNLLGIIFCKLTISLSDSCPDQATH